MNNSKRKALASILETLDEIRAALEGLLEEEQEYVDNTPENFQYTARYEAAEEACGLLQEAVDSLESAIDCIDQARG